MIKSAVASKLVEGMKFRPEGFTVNTATLEYEDCVGTYVVGGHVKGITLPYMLGSEWWYVLKNWVYDLPETVDYVGVWLENGVFYIDACDLFLSREAAFEVAILRNEIAVWNGYEGKVEWVDEQSKKDFGAE